MLTDAEKRDIEVLREALSRGLPTFSLQVHEPPHNQAPIQGRALSQHDNANIAGATRATVVTWFLAQGWAARWESWGVSSNQAAPNYDVYLIFGETPIDPWNPVPADVEVTGAQFTSPKIRRFVPLWFVGPGELRIDVTNQDQDAADFAAHIVGSIYPESQVPGSDINFYRGAH
jgi:hypothetical protein